MRRNPYCGCNAAQCLFKVLGPSLHAYPHAYYKWPRGKARKRVLALSEATIRANAVELTRYMNGRPWPYRTMEEMGR